MATAIGYVRVSTEGQATDGVSLDAQRTKIAAWCLANDIELGSIYIDAGLSGGRADNRPELQNALTEVCRVGGVLVVYSLSRLARSTKDSLEIAERLAKSGADLVSLSEKIDTTSAAGKMVFRMMAVLAEFERDQISERTSSVMVHKKSKGERVGTIPYGFKLNANGVNLDRCDSEQSVLELMKFLRSQGMTLRAIADELNSRAIPAKKGSQWKHGSVASVLENAT